MTWRSLITAPYIKHKCSDEAKVKDRTSVILEPSNGEKSRQ